MITDDDKRWRIPERERDEEAWKPKQEDIKSQIEWINRTTKQRTDRLKSQIEEAEKKRDEAVARLRELCEHECDPNSFIHDWCQKCGAFLG